MDEMPIDRFDASIDLVDSLVPVGMPPLEAMSRVRKAVMAIPGAGWISVDYAGLSPSALPRVMLYEPGRAMPRADGPWEGQSGVVMAVVRQALRR